MLGADADMIPNLISICDSRRTFTLIRLDISRNRVGSYQNRVVRYVLAGIIQPEGIESYNRCDDSYPSYHEDSKQCPCRVSEFIRPAVQLIHDDVQRFFCVRLSFRNSPTGMTQMKMSVTMLTQAVTR
jgi:hypothetical protein